VRRPRVPLARRALSIAALASVVVAAAACGWDPSKPFEREAPEVNDAIRALDAGDATAASATLQEYLTTGPCSEGKIGTPVRLHERPFGGFDLGLALFKIGEAYGKPFGEEESKTETDEATRALRAAEVECALHVVRAIGDDASAPVELRARARYLEGNLLFLDKKYKDAVKAYDKALELAPGMVDAGDAVGRDAAHNRAIALRRIEDERKDAGSDGGADAPPDSPPDAPPDAKPDANDGGNDAGKDGGDGKDGGGKDGGGKDGGADGASPNDQPPPKDEPKPQRPQQQDDRILDQLENAPTVQQEAARQRSKKPAVRGAEDK
jgi:tetratricopeptide (TPR) repeat protein